MGEQFHMFKKIMIVDDDPDILIYLRTVFERQHYEVLTVDSGNDCIRELERGFKGIVLMDLIMPFMDGWETLREMVKKGLTKDVVISIITANQTPNQQEMKEFHKYIHNFIPKPFDLERLISEIHSITTSKKIN